MFREIRTSERITDQDERKKKEMLMAIFDKRISDETIKELERFEKEADTFDPDKRIVVG